MAAVGTVRSVKNLYGMKRKHSPQVVIVSDSPEVFDSLQRSRCLIESLVPSGAVEVRKGGDDEASTVQLEKWSMQKMTDRQCTVFVEIASHIDVALELQRLSAKMQKLEKTRTKLQQGSKKTEKYYLSHPIKLGQFFKDFYQLFLGAGCLHFRKQSGRLRSKSSF